MLFRRQFTKEQGDAYLESVEGKQNNLSRIAGLVWRSMGEAEKAPYRALQEQLAQEHKLRNPDYKFTPERNGVAPKPRNNKNKELENARSVYVAGLHQQKLPTQVIAELAQRFTENWKAKNTSPSPTSSPARSPIEPPNAFVDPLYPPGDRTPQPRPAHPVVIELPAAPTSGPSSTSTSAPSPSSALSFEFTYSTPIASTEPDANAQHFPNPLFAPSTSTPALWAAPVSFLRIY